MGGKDPRLVFAPLIAIRPRSAQARVQILLDLANAPELSTAMRSLIETTDAHRAQVPYGPAIETRFPPDLLLPEPSSQAQRQMALSMERNPLTVVFGPPGTGKTYTIANLLGHLLARGKRLIVTAEKEEALHEVREKVLPELQDLVVPVLKGTSQERQRLGQAITRISAARREKELVEREQDVDRLSKHLENLRGKRSELVNSLGQAWSVERGLRLEAGPYRGTIEEVGSRLETDRDRFGWLSDRPGSPYLDVSDEDLARISRLTDPAIAAVADAATNVIDPDNFLSLDEVHQLANRLRASTSRADRRKHAVERRSARTTPTTLEGATAIADAIGSAMATLAAYLQGAPTWAAELFADVRKGDRDLWRGIGDRTSEEAASLMIGLERLGRHEVAVTNDRDPAAIKGAAQTIVAQSSPGKRLPRLLRNAQLKEAMNNLEGVLIDGSAVDTHEEAVAVQGWAEACIAHRRLAADWESRIVGLSGLTLRQAYDRARQLSQHLEEAHQVIDKIDSQLAPVTGAGVELEDRWSLDALQLDLYAVREIVEKAHIERISGYLQGVLQRIPRHLILGDELAEALSDLLERADPEPWKRTRDKVLHERSLRAAAQEGIIAKTALASTLPEFVATFDANPSLFVQRLTLIRDATAWAHAVGALSEVDSRRSILTGLDRVEAAMSEAQRQLVITLAWKNIHQRLADDLGLAQALRDYAAAQDRVPKTKTAKSYLPNLRRAQRALERCTDAVPVWVMAVDQVAEMFGQRSATGEPLTDVVIVDEASQSPITSAFVMQLAEAVAIVGDRYQTAPPSFKKFEHLQAARERISDRVVRDRLDPEASLWDIGAVAIDRIALTEHFRCPPEVIGWAEERIYRDLADINLEVLTGTDPQRPKPLILNLVENGYGDSTNRNEAEELVSDLTALLADKPAWVRDVGIVARTPYQAALLQRLVFDRFDQREIEAIRLRVGIPYQFQGAQRDLMYLSMTDGPPERGATHILRSFSSETVNQMNVAVSRARRQLRVFSSCAPNAYKTEDVRRSFLDHAANADQSWELRTAPGVPAVVSELSRVAPFDSLSEQRLFNSLALRGFAVRAHVPAPITRNRYWLDLVVDGQGGHVAIEYDGPHHDSVDQYLYDHERECDLVRCGWTILRVHHSEFNLDREGVADAVASQLRHHGVTPVVEWHFTPSDSGDERAESPDAGIWDVGTDARGPETQALDADAKAGGREGADSTESGSAPTVQTLSPVQVERFSYPTDDETATHGVEYGLMDAPLTPYAQFIGSVKSPLTATKEELFEGILAAVETEGPIVGERLIQVYNRAAGGQRAGKNIRRALNSAITALVRRGVLLEDNPLGAQGVKFRTYRLPDQPAVVERALGDRDIHDVPPAELASRLRRARSRGLDREACFRTVLDEYGLVRLTENTRATMSDAWQLVIHSREV
jgi:very-short-patch-repair endonuclease